MCVCVCRTFDLADQKMASIAMSISASLANPLQHSTNSIHQAMLHCAEPLTSEPSFRQDRLPQASTSAETETRSSDTDSMPSGQGRTSVGSTQVGHP